MTIAEQPTIILFDGACNLCSGVVKFLVARDPQARFRFATIQSPAARDACAKAEHELPAAATPGTFVVIERGRVLERSDAALAVARHTRFPGPMIGVFRLLPRGFRDALYGFVARNRYRWFGRAEACMAPTPELRSRFLG